MRYISAFDFYEGIHWFCANTFENKMLQYFTETSESHVGYFQLWRHILRHLRHLLAVYWKSHKPPFRLAQLILFATLFSWTYHPQYIQKTLFFAIIFFFDFNPYMRNFGKDFIFMSVRSYEFMPKYVPCK